MVLADRLGLAALIMTFIGVALVYLWPDQRWIGWICLAIGVALCVGWLGTELRKIAPPIVGTVVVGLLAGTGFGLAWWFGVAQGRPIAYIAKEDNFAVLIPLNISTANSPIPLNENSSDSRHDDYYRYFMTLAFVQNQVGKPPYNRHFASDDDQIAFARKLVHFSIFDSFYWLQRTMFGVKVRGSAGPGVTPITQQGILPPEPTPYSGDEILKIFNGNEFVNHVHQEMWTSTPLRVPMGTSVSIETQSGEDILVFERPNYFRLKFTVRSIGATGVGALPAGFVSSAKKSIRTHTVSVRMNYQVREESDGPFKPAEYISWLDTVYARLRDKLSF